VTLTWALMRNRGNQGVDAKGRSTSGMKPRGESTDATLWGGLVHSSDEGPVMGLERRGWVKRLHLRAQLETGGSL